MGDDNLNGRLLALTDGVLSIAMTLLVLDIRLPEASHNLSSAEIWQALGTMRPELSSFALSFYVTARLWLTHARCFRQLQKPTGLLLRLNFIFLFAVVLAPFTTALLADSDSGAAVIIYAAVMGIASLILGIMVLYSERSGLLPPPDKSEPWRQLLSVHFATALVFALSIIVAIWDASIAEYTWVFLIPVAFLRERALR